MRYDKANAYPDRLEVDPKDELREAAVRGGESMARRQTRNPQGWPIGIYFQPNC